MKRIALLLLLVAEVAPAAGPSRVATLDRSTWPRPLVKPADFDLASRLEILAFVQRLGEAPKTPAELRAWLKVSTVTEVSVERWRRQKLDMLAMNFANANLACARGKDLHCVLEAPKAEGLLALAKRFDAALPADLAKWREASRKFYDTYVYEQLRIAALFPSPTSEALTHAPSELTGDDMDDRKFLLTFDDGPTPAGGNTDRLLDTLKPLGVNAIFFLLGDALAARGKLSSPETLRKLYAGQCIASHGREHTSHQKRADWRQSIDDTTAALRSSFRENLGLYPLFRPPYGQRGIELTRYVEGRESRVMLWNIDSQDWNQLIPAEQITGRIVTLMLLWRRGILLFHDVHDKARVAVPEIIRTMKPFAQWQDCRHSLL